MLPLNSIADLNPLPGSTDFIWVFPKIGVITPKWMVYNGKPYENG